MKMYPREQGRRREKGRDKPNFSWKRMRASRFIL
jgi:hypothetical protein